MKNANIEAEVNGRVKHFFSIYKKMVNQDKTVDQIYDLFAIPYYCRFCQGLLCGIGVIHEMYTPIPGRFKDYIAMPKANMYQSLHTTLMSSTDSRLRSRSVQKRCIKQPNTVLPHTGNIKRLQDGKKSVERTGRREVELAASDPGMAERHVR